MNSKKTVKDAVKSFIKALIRTTVLFIALVAILFSGMLLGQREALHDFNYAEVGVDPANSSDPDASNDSAIDEPDELKWAEVKPVSPISPLEGAHEAQQR